MTAAQLLARQLAVEALAGKISAARLKNTLIVIKMVSK